MTATDTPIGRARHLLDVNRADDAITILNRHLADSPQDATALTLLASANLQLNRAAEALDSSLKALAVDPHRLTAWQHRSMALRQLGRHDEAAAAAQEFVRLAPTLWTSHYTLGLVLRGMTGRRGEALGCANRAVELAPESADPYVLLGLLYSDAHDYSRAEDYYRTALGIDPQHAFATSNLSGLELRRGRFVRAMRGFRTAAALSPQEDVFHRNIVATVLGSLVKYGLMLAVITGFAALIVAGTVGSGWVPRLVVLGVVLGAWATLLVTKLRPLSRYLRRRLRSSLLASLRTGRFRLLACGFLLHQACAFTVLLDPGIGAPELLITVGNVALLGAMMAGRRLATR